MYGPTFHPISSLYLVSVCVLLSPFPFSYPFLSLFFLSLSPSFLAISVLRSSLPLFLSPSFTASSSSSTPRCPQTSHPTHNSQATTYNRVRGQEFYPDPATKPPPSPHLPSQPPSSRSNPAPNPTPPPPLYTKPPQPQPLLTSTANHLFHILPEL